MENKRHGVTIIEMVDISGPRFTVGVVFHYFEKIFMDQMVFVNWDRIVKGSLQSIFNQSLPKTSLPLGLAMEVFFFQLLKIWDIDCPLTLSSELNRLQIFNRRCEWVIK